jgi:hypothetical protein
MVFGMKTKEPGKKPSATPLKTVSGTTPQEWTSCAEPKRHVYFKQSLIRVTGNLKINQEENEIWINDLSL